jgi:hypothetical protein
VTITLSPPIYPTRLAEGSESTKLREMVRLRDMTREVIAQHSGEPLL